MLVVGLVDVVFSGWFDFDVGCCVYLVLAGCFDCVVWGWLVGWFLCWCIFWGFWVGGLVFVVLCDCGLGV